MMSTNPGLLALTLAWRPFIDPLNLHDRWWILLVPLSFGVAVVYKAVRVKTLEKYWREVAIMTTQIVIAMILLGAAVYLFIEFYVRWVADSAG